MLARRHWWQAWPLGSRSGWGRLGLGYGVAVLGPLLAGLLRYLLDPLSPGLVPFATFFPAVLVAAVLGGLGPGLLATLLSLACAWALGLLLGPAAVFNVILFAVVCLSIVAIAEAGRQAQARSLASEQLPRLLADAVDDVFWVLDLRRQQVRYVSSAYERIWGRSAVEHAFDAMLRGETDSFELVYRMQDRDGAIRWLRDKAWRLRADGHDQVFGIVTDVTAEKAAGEQQRLVAQEMSHRLKNSFALMLSVLHLSARRAPSVAALVESLDGRIQALVRSQDLLLHGATQPATLAGTIEAALAPYRTGEGRIVIHGPPVRIAAAALPVLHMAFHELATNAAKYGALAQPGGRIEVTWQIAAGNAPEVLLRWQELGGSIALPAGRDGFGSVLIRQVTAMEFGGEVTIELPPAGLICAMRLPISAKLQID